MFIYRFIISFLYFLMYPCLRLIFAKQNFSKRVSFQNNNLDKSIWIHAASVGEINAVKMLVRTLTETYTQTTFLMTAMTKAGVETAKNISNKLIVRYFPLDLPHLMKRAFLTYHPSLIILVETEIWPNMLYQAYQHKVPVIIINARLSIQSFRRFRLLKLMLHKEFSNICLVCAQSEIDAERFQRLKLANVKNTNNLKFALHLPHHEKNLLRIAWNYHPDDFIISFGCSRPGEEEIMKRVRDKLKTIIPNLKIIIAPRHIQRVNEIKEIFAENEVTIFSDIKPNYPFLIIDEMGILPQMYALSDIVLIGGSFLKFGGHNPLEAVWYEKPVIMGKYYYSCQSTVEKLLSEQAIIISDEESLINDIHTLYLKVEHRLEIGKKAKGILLQNQHALENHLQAINKYLDRL